MSISIETNLALICSAFNISYQKITHDYSGMTINQIMKEEEAQGNSLVSKFNNDLISNPKKLIEFIQLNIPENKFAILSNMNEDDLFELMPLLESEDLVQGLNFFNESTLLEFVAELPGKQGANIALQMFSPEHLMALMPKEALDEVLLSKEMQDNKGLERQCIQVLPPEIMAQMIESVTGEVPDGVLGVDMSGQPTFDIKALNSQIQGFDDETFQASLLAIPESFKQIFMLRMTQEEPKIWTLFDSKYFAAAMVSRKHKDDIIAASSVLEKEFLMGMNAQLPKELLAVVITQINTEMFAKMLQKNFADVLGQLSIS